MAMTEEARRARNKYRREWYRKNPEKQAEYQNNYWIRQARKELDKMKPYDKQAGV
jgi:hypothetical protein